jgi:carbon monoxide dehydrogenase subunit G
MKCLCCTMMFARTNWRAAAAAGALLAILGTGTGVAAQIDAITVTHRGDGFKIVFDGVVDAPAPQVYEVLADYARLGKLNPVITAISVDVGPNGRGERVRSVIKACVWFFCTQLVQVEDVTEPDGNTIVAHIVPGEGDFASGSCFWRVTEKGPRTRLHYEATRVAAFWIPPLIGPWVIRRTAREQFESSIVVLERLANEKARS